MAYTFPLVDVNKKIQIVPGKMFTNRTYKYLSPSMKLYGEEFVTKIKLLKGVCCGIQDFGFNLDKDSRVFDNNIYYVFDINGEFIFGKYSAIEKSRKDFFHIISWLREQPYYVQDYPLDSGRNESKHVIVLQLPLPLLDNFLKGNYTNLYSKDIIDKIINKTIKVLKTEEINPVYAVLTKSPEYQEEYLRQLNSDFNTTLTLKDIGHHDQYDIPPLLKNEIIRW